MHPYTLPCFPSCAKTDAATNMRETARGRRGGDVSPSIEACRHSISAQLFSVGESRTGLVADFKIGVMDRIVNYRL